MATAKAVLKIETNIETEPAAESLIRSATAPSPAKASLVFPIPTPENEPPAPRVNSQASAAEAVPLSNKRRDNHSSNFQPRVPVITGEASFRGMMPVDGIISGQLGANGSSLTMKQRPHSLANFSGPELDGEINFKDMLRINGHIAGKVASQKGILIVDGSAQVDGDIDVGVVVISGRVNGDVIARERVELGPAAVITGNIATRSLTMKPGAFFQGDCRMLTNEDS